MQPKVGIVILSHNASQAVRITLASVRQAQNDTSAKVILIDNSSFDMEREKIKTAFERHIQEATLPWEYIQLKKNLGFPAGNNIGIKRFLEDPDITHICLLNSDVIVPDHWLDQLVSTGVDIVSAVTNKAESEQCIPIDYNIAMEECLDRQTEGIHFKTLKLVNDFARDWHAAWNGNLVEGEATFFCVLLSRKILENVGLLDETFFPGGYKDEDFCLRARHKGFEVYIDRSVFIHHWGSASFGQLQFEYFNENASRNLNYLENKHGIIRKRRPEKPFVSFLMDIQFAAAKKNDFDPALRQRFYEIYLSQLGKTLRHYESEFRNLQRTVDSYQQAVPHTLHTKIQQAMAHDNLLDLWKQLTFQAESIFVEGFHTAVSLDKVLAGFEELIEGIWQRVECNFAIHAFILRSQGENASDQTVIKPRLNLRTGLQKVGRVFRLIIQGMRFFWNLQGVVFFGGYPYPELQSDGYYQRIQMVDHLFAERWRIYIRGRSPSGRQQWFDRPEAKVLVLQFSGGFIQRVLVQTLGLMCILKCRRIYFHSILAMQQKSIGWLFYIPGLTRVIDIHGAVTEEFRLHNDFFNAMRYERLEHLAVSRCDVIVVVTKSMENYLRQKYRETIQGQVILFPMFPNYPKNIDPRPYVSGKPVVVYAGGLQKWQQVPKMLDTIRYTASEYDYRFYCPEPQKVQELLPETVRPKVIVGHKTPEELVSLYPECHYGFILREDNVVNQVACPTKLVEYLAMGIVPIVNTTNIGDFSDMGMQSVTLDALLRGLLPDEAQRTKMANENSSIYERLHNIYKHGAHDLWVAITDKSQKWDEGLRLAWLKRLLPPHTRLGRWMRISWIHLKTIFQGSTHKNNIKPELVVPSLLPECDILVQVDNFAAGGLENIVLDINDALLKAGYRIILLVLGNAGVGIERARERGTVVIIGSAENEWYQAFLEQVCPKLVLAHYSIFGAAVSHSLGIPFVQVIQSTYMWFDPKQLAAFENAAQFTTKFIALSEYAKRYSVERLRIPENSCIVLPCGIDCNSFDNLDVLQTRQNLRSQYNLNEKNFVFLSVGAINHQKNHIATVRAFTFISKEIPLARLVILGPAYEKQLLDEIVKLVEKQGLEDRIIYAGSAPNAYKHYVLADAFVSASFFEGGPLNLLEALKANLPTIMTNVGLAQHFKGVRGVEIIEPPVDIMQFHGGLLQLTSTADFEKHLATAMLKIYNNPQKPDLPGELLQAFDKSNAYRLYVDVIEKLIRDSQSQVEVHASYWPKQIEGILGEGI